MEINQAGIDLIKSCEGCKLEAYPDPGSGGDPWTVGFGHTGPDVSPGMIITQDEADTLLKQDLVKFNQGVSDLLTVQITANQFSALVCFAYNVGLANLKSSLLLRCINTMHYADAAPQFLRWNKAAGIIMPGLTIRREKERDLFLS